jgi:adenine-specific DNA-methyltransferase
MQRRTQRRRRHASTSGRRHERAADERRAVIKYLGSKRRLVPELVRLVGSFPQVRTVVDLFSGTSRVGHALKAAGCRVLANDHNAYAETLARCYVAADREDVESEARALIAELNALPGAPGWFTATYCEEARFFRPENGARIEAIRHAIAERRLRPELEAVLLVALLEAADRVDSTTGVQMAYLKAWAPRAHQPLALRLPALLPRAAHGKGEATGLDALEAARRLSGDLAYLDPPYNQHSYLGNYHVWETLVRWDRPEVSGVARTRSDCRTRQSALNSRPRHRETLAAILDAVDARLLILSFSDEGYLARAQLEALLARRGAVRVYGHDTRRYIGAQIGIFDPQGRKVGRVSHLRNTEYLYVAGPAADLERAGLPPTDVPPADAPPAADGADDADDARDGKVPAIECAAGTRPSRRRT